MFLLTLEVRTRIAAKLVLSKPGVTFQEYVQRQVMIKPILTDIMSQQVKSREAKSIRWVPYR